MFLNNNILKRLMKQAYKTGLIVAQTDKRIYISGEYWEMDVRREFLPKQILAQIIELAGELPNIGERFRANKDENQMEMGMRMEVDTDGFVEGIDVTKVLLIGKHNVIQRILQSESGKTYIANNVFVAIADNLAIEEDAGEYKVTKPMYNDSKGLLWMNNVARFHAWWRTDENHERLLAEIAQIDLTEDAIE